MGCDIHYLVEHKIGDRWHFYSADGDMVDSEGKTRWPLAGARNYTRFARLAGVRAYGNEGVDVVPHGLPPDLCPMSEVWMHDRCWDHSHSWLPLRDAMRIWFETEQHTLEPYQIERAAETYFGVEDLNLDAYRVVFAFDN